MAYTFTEKTFTDDSIFESLYSDSLADIQGGTVHFCTTLDTEDAKKQYVKGLICDQNYTNMKNIEVAKDGVVCMWVQGSYEDNTFTWKNVLVGKINNSKAWTWTSEFHEANKAWIQSLGGTKFALECIKDSRIDTYFTTATSSNICLGNLTTQELPIFDSVQMKIMTWEY